MRAARLSRRWTVAACFALWAVALPGAAMAQSPPLKVTISLKNPPADLTYPTGSPIILDFRVQNVSGNSIITNEGFSTDLWRQLFLRDPQGNLVADKAAAEVHKDTQPIPCFSRNGALQRPTALSLVPVEVLLPDFFRQWTIDLTRFFDISRPGRWTANARVQLVKFDVSDPNTVVTDCDDLAGAGVNVGTDPGDPKKASTIKRDAFLINSNFVEFIVSQLNFIGFNPPVVNDTDPKCTALPCKTYKKGSTLPVSFQLRDEHNAPVTNATPRIAVEWVSPDAPPQIPEDLGTSANDIGNRFRLVDPLTGKYLFGLSLKLQPGTYRVDAILDDGFVHSVHIGVR